MTTIRLDYETACDVDLKKVGLDVYTAHESFRVLMAAYKIDNDEMQHWDATEDPRIPSDLAECLRDPHVTKKAFNAQFERVATRRGLGIKTPIKNWRCTMALAYMQSFVGDLTQVGKAVGLPQDKQKLGEGKRLIRLFTMPQRITKNQPLLWRDSWTDPEDWELFCDYNRQDVVAEEEIERRLIRYPVPDFEWQLYEIDQAINDRGLPIDMQFVENAIAMSARRKAELQEEMRDLTGLANPNSPAQLLPWLQERGYPFSDLQKATVKKVITEHEEGVVEVDEECVDGLRLRQQASRTSTAKYTQIKLAVGPGSRFRFGFQFAAASRTNRWAGRRVNPQNLARTPKELEQEFILEAVTDCIRRGDYEELKLWIKEPLEALAGLVRSAIRAPDDMVLEASDLASIETCVIAWLSGCERLLEVIRSGKDPYKDFGTILYAKDYDDITKKERTDSKPAVLGAGFRLGGGKLEDGKRTGLWGYAESMGINLSLEDSHKSVRLFRENYPEIPKLWYALEEAIEEALKSGRVVTPKIKHNGRTFHVPVKFEMLKPYMTAILPTGRRMYYHLPRMVPREFTSAKGEKYTKKNFSYMGQPQGTKMWTRVFSHGGKVTENLVQAIARDVLAYGMMRVTKLGFKLCGHVHDELISLISTSEKRLRLDLLKATMIQDIPGLEGLPLGAAGWSAPFYRKD